MGYNPQNPNGSATSANSSPVVIASDQAAVAVTATQSTASSLNATVVQATGTNLHTVVDSGTVTANAGTNLNTSALALESGGHLASLDTKLPSQGIGTVSTSVPVVLPTSQITTLTPPTTVTVQQTTAGNLNANVSQSVAANLNATVVQSTAASLNATVVGTTAAGSGASSGLVTVQGNASGTAIPISNASLTTLASTIAATSAAVPADALQIGVKNGSNLVPITQGSATSANSIPVVIASDQASFGSKVAGTAIGNAPIQNTYSSTNITTSAYVQLVASTTNVINTIHIFDSSGQAMILGIGGSGSEVTTLYVPPGGDTYTLNIPAGSRLAYKALTATANSGYLLMSFLE